MSERTLKAGTHLFFGAPAKPMPRIMADAISQVVAQVPGISEAYLPQCFIQGDTEARQVLVVGVHRNAEIPRVAEALMGKLQLVFPPGQYIDIMPFPAREVPQEARQAGFQIFKCEEKPWWKFW